MGLQGSYLTIVLKTIFGKKSKFVLAKPPRVSADRRAMVCECRIHTYLRELRDLFVPFLWD